MKNLRTSVQILVALLLIVSMAACGDDNKDSGSSGSNGSAPTVVSVFPSSGASAVATNSNVIARFSTAMNATTITTANYTLTGPGTTPVTGTVSYDSANYVADFLPAAPLAASTLFTATLSTGVKATNGKSLASSYTWNFTTGTTADTTAPTVTSTSPADLATGVSINSKVTATFSEQMDSSTATSTTFTLANGMTPISGSVSCPGTTATFTPSANLPTSTLLTATVTTGVADLADNPLATTYTWTFTTGTTTAMGPAKVVLGTAGNFAILGKSTVTTTGATAVTGDVGLSPAAASFFTGFAETLDGSGEFATSIYVPSGRMYAATYTAPTPSILTTAILDMQTAYDDAAGRTLPDSLNLGGGNIDGMTLTPGLYKWGTTVNISTSLTLNGSSNDVWIFQIEQNLIVGNGAIITLTGGASASNIIWQVAGQATLGTTSDFKGVILCKTQIVMMSGSIMLGRALAQTAVTLDATTITEP